MAIDAIAQQTGFGEATNLRKHFRKIVGLSPSRYRVQFETHN
ncbi:helix-turn-helix domain-containing protein [Halomonas sp. WWR20]